MERNFENREIEKKRLEYYELTEEEKKEMSLDHLIWSLLNKYKILYFARYPEGKNKKQLKKVKTEKSEEWDDEYESEKLPRNTLSFLDRQSIERNIIKLQKQKGINEASEWKFTNAVEAITKIISRSENENIGLASWLLKEESSEKTPEFNHIPMIDFNCPITEQSKEKILKFLEELGEKEGFLLVSGNSYHYYGMKSLSEKEWKNFNKKISASEIVGEVWPRLQLKNKVSILRISTSPAKPVCPQIIGVFGKEFKNSLFKEV